MNIGEAVQALREGKKVTRPNWNGKKMYLWLDEPVEGHIGTYEELPFQETVYIRTAQNNHVAWLCSQTDLLANDWEVLVE